MPNQPIVTAGLVLRETVTRETDKILTVLTPDRGKISLIARGARRKNSRLAAACQLLAYSELTIYEKGQWFMLDEAETLELFTGLVSTQDMIDLTYQVDVERQPVDQVAHQFLVEKGILS